MTEINSMPSKSGEASLLELIVILWRGKWIIFFTTLLFGFCSIIFAKSLPNIYKAEALLAPVEDSTQSGLAGLAGQFGGLANLANFNLGAQGSNKSALALEVLKSRAFLSKFIKQHDLLVPLIAAEGWDRGRDQLIIDSDLYNPQTSKWVRESKPPRSPEPSMQEAYGVFLNRMSVTQDKKTSFVLISVEHYSPLVAKQWVDWLVEDINTEIKLRDLNEARKSIEYLTNQVQKTSIADMQAVFFELIEEQSKTIMFAEVRDEYVFKTIDEAVIPELRTRPQRALICMLGVVFGGMIGVLCALGWHYYRMGRSVVSNQKV